MDFELFIGRFHPLVVHLPIGFILLAAILEVLNQRYKDKFGKLDSAISISLFYGGISAAFSALIGYLLSSGGGYDEQTLFWHQWLGIGLGIFALFGWAAKAEYIKLPKNSSSVIIGALVVMVSFIGHLGGNLTHGSDYLLAYAPEFVQNMAGMNSNRNNLASIPTNPDSILVFQHLVQPILVNKCAGCHNKTKSKGGLILTSIEDIEKGGEDDHAIVGGNPSESNLFIRTTLPQSSKKFMPPKGEPLTYAEIKLLQWWIETGASAETHLTESEVPFEIEMLLSRDLGIGTKAVPYFDQTEVALLSEDNFTQLANAGFDAKLLSNIHNYIQVQSAAKQVSSEQIKTLLTAKEQITWLNLREQSINDSMMKTIAQLTNLTTLELNNNPISNAGIELLVNLTHLEVLNLYGTEISDEVLKSIKQLPALKRLYLWQTKVSEEGIEKSRTEFPNMKIIGGSIKKSEDTLADEQ